jgi:hypothetical protein
MPKYVVRVEGVECRIRIEREDGTVSMTSGFFTTRFVEAAEPREAQSRAFLLIWKELTRQDWRGSWRRADSRSMQSGRIRKRSTSTLPVRVSPGISAQYWLSDLLPLNVTSLGEAQGSPRNWCPSPRRGMSRSGTDPQRVLKPGPANGLYNQELSVWRTHVFTRCRSRVDQHRVSG